MDHGNDDDNGGRRGELLAEGKKDDSHPSPQSIHRPRQRELRRQKSSENRLLSFINLNKSDDKLEVEVELEVEIEREPNTIPHTKNDNDLSTGQEREINTIALTDSCSLYNELSEQEQFILRQHISQSSLPQMKTRIATDIRTRIILWEMKESFQKVPPGYTHANGNIIPSQEDKEGLWAAERHLRAGRERWVKERVDSVGLSTILERSEEEG